jgi:hypothetical protein
VGDWLLGGRQFLHQSGQIPAITMEIHLAGRSLELVLSATVVRFPLLQPEDLGVDFQSLQQFVLSEDRNCCLTRDQFGRQSVLVLPRLSSATLISVSKQLPEGSRFSDWATMKRYWKNMYGYRLELEDGSEPTVYYNVSFGAGPSLTYVIYFSLFQIILLTYFETRRYGRLHIDIDIDRYRYM